METENPQQPTSTPQPSNPTPVAPNPAKNSSKIIIILLFVIITLLLGVIGYFYFMNNTKETATTTPTPTVTQAIATPSPSISPTQAINIDENTQAAIESKNYAALEGYMTPSVSVLLYASECCGPQTPTQALAQLDYFNEAKAPWNWNQESETIKQIKAEHPTTFGKGTIGIADNEYTVSYEVVNGKINALYISASYKLLIP